MHVCMYFNPFPEKQRKVKAVPLVKGCNCTFFILFFPPMRNVSQNVNVTLEIYGKAIIPKV